MSKPTKPRRSSQQIKRIRTLRERKSREQISADARKGGLKSTGHFNSEKAKAANKKRWDAYRAAQKEKEKGI